MMSEKSKREVEEMLRKEIRHQIIEVAMRDLKLLGAALLLGFGGPLAQACGALLIVYRISTYFSAYFSVKDLKF